MMSDEELKEALRRYEKLKARWKEGNPGAEMPALDLATLIVQAAWNDSSALG